jgi:hypothetical protein
MIFRLGIMSGVIKNGRATAKKTMSDEGKKI